MNERKCNNCPAFYRCSDEGLSANGGGWIEKEIDGKNVPVCRPGALPGKKRTMQQYSFYCLATVTGRKIGGIAEWTGRTPKWCPLGRELATPICTATGQPCCDCQLGRARAERRTND